MRNGPPVRRPAPVRCCSVRRSSSLAQPPPVRTWTAAGRETTLPVTHGEAEAKPVPESLGDAFVNPLSDAPAEADPPAAPLAPVDPDAEALPDATGGMLSLAHGVGGKPGLTLPDGQGWVNGAGLFDPVVVPVPVPVELDAPAAPLAPGEPL